MNNATVVGLMATFFAGTFPTLTLTRMIVSVNNLIHNVVSSELGESSLS